MASAPTAVKDITPRVKEVYVSPIKKLIDIKTVINIPILAANFFGPALTICDWKFPTFNTYLILVQTGLYFTPKKILIIKSIAEKKMTSLNGVNK